MNKIESQIKSIDQMQNLLTKLKDSDLGKLGNSKTDKDKKEIEKYLGKLKEVYNWENKLATMEDRIENLDSYLEYTKGDDWTRYYKERIGLLEDELSIHDKIMRSYGDMVEAEQIMIKNSQVGDVFSFDKFGNIVIDYDKYLKLQDESIDGKETLKELADDLYDEYVDLYQTLQDKEDAYLETLTRIVDAQKEQIENYIDLEKQVADAVKEIYQRMLDDKLSAIDAEISALDKLTEAYEKANQAAKNSREISNLQENLKRSMMDTSGASNTKVLSYRDQIRSKLEEMGEDEYTERLDGIKEALEDQKDYLQTQFDRYFEDYEALYTMIEKMIIEDKDAVVSVLQTTDEYLQASDIERKQLVDDWTQLYTTAMVGLENGKSIFDVWQSMQDNIAEIGTLDTNLQTYINDGVDDIGKYFSEAIFSFENSMEKAADKISKKFESISSVDIDVLDYKEEE